MIVDVNGWKGKDDVQVVCGLDKYQIIEHRQNKESGLVTTNTYEVPAVRVWEVWSLIKANCKLGEIYGYRYIVNHIVKRWDFWTAEGLTIEKMIDAFNGGKNRAKYYFPYYYYPMKVLEYLGHIQYFGRGGLRRLK